MLKTKRWDIKDGHKWKKKRIFAAETDERAYIQPLAKNPSNISILNFPIIAKIPPEDVIFSDFIATFAMSCLEFYYLRFTTLR